MKRHYKIFLISGLVTVSSGCASYVSITAGDLSSEHTQAISSELVTALMSTRHGDEDMVFLHASRFETALQAGVENALRTNGVMLDVGSVSDSVESKAALKIAFRANTFDEGKYGSYCLLVGNESTTVCREYELESGRPTTLLSVAGLEYGRSAASKINDRKGRIAEELIVESDNAPANNDEDKAAEEVIIIGPVEDDVIDEESSVKRKANLGERIARLYGRDVVWSEMDSDDL